MNKFKLRKKFTKKWKSGYTTLAIISNNEHEDRNYIILERKLIGKPQNDQNFNLHLEDWEQLKKLVESEAVQFHKWPVGEKLRSETQLLKEVGETSKKDPEFFAKVLSHPNIANLGDASFEALDYMGTRIYEIKTENLDFLLQEISKAKASEIDSFISILDELKIGQISSIVELVKKKISIISLLTNLLKNRKTKEKEIHILLEKHLWLLDNNYDLVLSDKTLSDFLYSKIKDPDLQKRPDLILKTLLQDSNHLILVELKRPSVKLHPDHIGQILGYKGIIERHNPKIEKIDIFLIGYDVHQNFPNPKKLKDLEVDLLGNIVKRKRREFNDFLQIIEENKEISFKVS